MIRALLLLLAACAGPPLPEPFVVSDLRVIAMVASSAQIRPDGHTTVTAYFFDPDSEGRSVQARFYQCDERGESEGTVACAFDGSPQTELAVTEAERIGTDLFAASFVYTPPPDVLSSRGAFAQRYGFEEMILVRGDNGLRFIDGAKRVSVEPLETPVLNANPVLHGFNLQLNSVSLGNDSSVDAVTRGTAYVLSPLADPQSSEQYQVVDFSGESRLLTEELTYSWSCSPDCVVSQRVSHEGGVITLTTPRDGAESGRFTVHLVLRDGRGGEAVHVRTFALLPQARIF